MTGSDLVITLSNGATVTIAVGQTTGTSTAFAVQGDDVYVDGSTDTLTITGTTGGNFEALDTADTGTVTVNDTVDTTTASLSATPLSIDEDGATIRYTVTLDNAASGAMTVTLDNGESITIADGATSGFVDVAIAADSDVYVDFQFIEPALSELESGDADAVYGQLPERLFNNAGEQISGGLFSSMLETTEIKGTSLE